MLRSRIEQQVGFRVYSLSSRVQSASSELPPLPPGATEDGVGACSASVGSPIPLRTIGVYSDFLVRLEQQTT